MSDERCILEDDQIEVLCLDERGAGNACHSYAVNQSKFNKLQLGNIKFQNGPIKDNGVNGVTNEALIAVVIDRLEGFQSGEYKCEENRKALVSLIYAQRWLERRTAMRVERGVEGTNVI